MLSDTLSRPHAKQRSQQAIAHILIPEDQVINIVLAKTIEKLDSVSDHQRH